MTPHQAPVSSTALSPNLQMQRHRPCHFITPSTDEPCYHTLPAMRLLPTEAAATVSNQEAATQAGSSLISRHLSFEVATKSTLCCDILASAAGS